jgi:hypothetical protein
MRPIILLLIATLIWSANADWVQVTYDDGTGPRGWYDKKHGLIVVTGVRGTEKGACIQPLNAAKNPKITVLDKWRGQKNAHQIPLSLPPGIENAVSAGWAYSTDLRKAMEAGDLKSALPWFGYGQADVDAAAANGISPKDKAALLRVLNEADAIVEL